MTSRNKCNSASINATAIHNNGQSIWFYEWNHIESLDSYNNAFRFNMACEDGTCTKYEIRSPAKEIKKEYAGVSIGSSPTRSAEDLKKTKYNKLMEDVIQNMVVSFAKG